MKPALQLKLSQHLALTPQLQQSIKLLQLSTVEMQQEIENYLFENPMLERDDDGGHESFAAAQHFERALFVRAFTHAFGKHLGQAGAVVSRS